jgi:ubiquitin carboxyl-terminal hydrolase L3
MPPAFAFHDVYGLDDPDLLAMIPQPVRALILLFPITPATERRSKARDAELEAAGAPVSPDGVFYMKQTIGNACGTIAMLHAIANSRAEMGLLDDGKQGDEDEERSFLRRFFAATAPLSPEERGRFLESPPAGAPDLAASHRRAAERGDTAAPEADADVDLHFVALVPAAGRVWELDGRRRGPVDHGPLADGDAGSFLQDAARVARAYFKAEEGEEERLDFSLIALGAAADEE